MNGRWSSLSALAIADQPDTEPPKDDVDTEVAVASSWICNVSP